MDKELKIKVLEQLIEQTRDLYNDSLSIEWTVCVDRRRFCDKINDLQDQLYAELRITEKGVI